MKRFLHQVAHFLKWNLGTVVSARRQDQVLWMGFRCATCGWVTGKHPTTRLLMSQDHVPPTDGEFRA